MQFTVDVALHGQRIEKILQSWRSGITRSQWKYFVETGKVLVEGRPASWGDRVRAGNRVELLEEPVDRDLWPPAACEVPALTVAARGEGYLVLDKPAGIPTLARNPRDVPTAAGVIATRWPEVVEAAVPRREAGIVNRLDNDTSGLLLVALHPDLYERFRKYFMNHHVEKEYYALCRGALPKRLWVDGRVISETGPSDRVGWETGDGPRGKRAVSLMEPLAQAEGLTLVRVVTRFGRRHQVRVQLASLGCPLVGDAVYGDPARDPVPRLAGHFLWARRITFPLRLRVDGETGPVEEVVSTWLPAPWLELVNTLGLGACFDNVTPYALEPLG